MEHSRKKCKCAIEIPIPDTHIFVGVRKYGIYINRRELSKRHSWECKKAEMPCTIARFQMCRSMGIFDTSMRHTSIARPIEFTPDGEVIVEEYAKIDGISIKYNPDIYVRYSVSRPTTRFQDDSALNGALHVKSDTYMTTQPSGIAFNLHDHQLANLAFMREKEHVPPFWTHNDGIYWIDRRGNDMDAFAWIPVPVIYGGFICDKMGMGKTITAAALIADGRPDPWIDIQYIPRMRFKCVYTSMNLELPEPDYLDSKICARCSYKNAADATVCECGLRLPKHSSLRQMHEMDKTAAHRLIKVQCGGTLYCTMSKLVPQVAKQLKDAIPGVKVVVYHGAKRPRDQSRLCAADVVVASYSTLASEVVTEAVGYEPEYCKRRSWEIGSETMLKDIAEGGTFIYEGILHRVFRFGMCSIYTVDGLCEPIPETTIVNKVTYSNIRCTGVSKGSNLHCEKCGFWSQHIGYHNVIQSNETTDLFDIFWHRLILDESHVLSSRSTKTHAAVSILNTNSVWALTGTPYSKSTREVTWQMDAMGMGYTDNPVPSLHLAGIRSSLTSEMLIPSTITTHDVPVVIEPSVQALLTRACVTMQLDYHAARKSGGNMLLSIRRMRRVMYAVATGRVDRLLPTDFEYDETFDYSKVTEPVQASGLEIKGTIDVDKLRRAPEDECPVCMEENTDPIAFGCHHVFCKACVKGMLASSRRRACPFCRVSITSMKSVVESSVEPSAPDSPPPVPPSPEAKTRTVPVCANVKVDVVVGKILELLRANPDNRIIVFTQFSSIVTGVLEALDAHAPLVKPKRLDGKTSLRRRYKAMEDLSTDKANVLVASLSCGATGLDIYASNIVMFSDLSVNRELEAQAIGRAHRIGQTRDVSVFRFYSQDTLEERILENKDPLREMRDLTTFDPDSLKGQLVDV